MSLLEMLRETSRVTQKLNKTESKIMETLMIRKSGNAYGLWKASKLKHYPTVLRTLRKLNEKNLVGILSKDGTRRETTYAPTIQGSILFYILRNEEEELLDFLIKSSRLFKEFHELQKSQVFWVYSVIRQAFWVEGREKVSIDELVRSTVEESVRDSLWNICDQDACKQLRKFWKVSWIKPIIIESMEHEIGVEKRELKALTELKREFNTD